MTQDAARTAAASRERMAWCCNCYLEIHLLATRRITYASILQRALGWPEEKAAPTPVVALFGRSRVFHPLSPVSSPIMPATPRPTSECSHGLFPVAAGQSASLASRVDGNRLVTVARLALPPPRRCSRPCQVRLHRIRNLARAKQRTFEKQPRSTTVLLAPGEVHMVLGTGSAPLCATRVRATQAAAHPSGAPASTVAAFAACFARAQAALAVQIVLDGKKRWSQAIGARAASDSPAAARPVNAACDWELGLHTLRARV
jgi:hypothetical protein